jgi:hypothetical protein
VIAETPETDKPFKNEVIFALVEARSHLKLNSLFAFRIEVVSCLEPVTELASSVHPVIMMQTSKSQC